MVRFVCRLFSDCTKSPTFPPGRSQKPWAFIGVPNMNSNVLGLQGQGFLIRFLHYHIKVNMKFPVSTKMGTARFGAFRKN